MSPRRAARPSHMPSVISSLSVSVDGFIARPDGSVGDLFEWYGNGEVPVEHSSGRVDHLSATNAAVFRENLDRTGCFMVGRGLYDLTHGWEARPPADAPMVVVTHAAPPDPPTGGVPLFFATDGVEAAVAQAKALAGDKDVSVAAGGLTRSVLDAGLLDELVVTLVPLILGAGIPWLAGAAGPVRLSDPEVVAGERATHLRYRVLGTGSAVEAPLR